MTTPVRAFSYGGGVQSTAALVLAARGEIEFSAFLFANVGADSENPDTLSFVAEHARPFAAAHGIELHELRATIRGEPVTLMREIERRDSSYVIPVKFEPSGMGQRRCTYDFKIAPIARWLKRCGASAANPAVVGIGISLDEFQRARTDSGFAHYRIVHPLIDLRLDRGACMRIITDAGLPVPPKSSCFFCPFHTLGAWRGLRDTRPDLLDRAEALENTLRERMQRRQGVNVWLTDARRPLREAVGDGVQLPLFSEEDVCESGYCMV